MLDKEKHVIYYTFISSRGKVRLNHIKSGNHTIDHFKLHHHSQPSPLKNKFKIRMTIEISPSKI